MIALDEDALICDLAETYRIYDYRSLPVKLVATLSSGLRENSRIRMEMRGDKLPYAESLLAWIYDAFVNYTWALYGEAKEPPKSIFDILTGAEPQNGSKPYETFESGADFDTARKRLLRGE